MSEIILPEDAGYVTVKAGDVEVRLDAFEVNDRVADLQEQYRGRPATEFAAAVQDLIESLGLPRVSVFAAGQFVRGIVGACESLKKSVAPSAESPASTASTPGN